jgi:CYTH domain-containing protein
MKAIVNVNKNSHYVKFNGLTFEVKELLSKQVALLIPNVEFGKDITTDFGFKEVIIVDIVDEIAAIKKKCMTDPTANAGDFGKRDKLLTYKLENKLQF